MGGWAAYGCQDFRGLRLVANCLYSEFREGWEGAQRNREIVGLVQEYFGELLEKLRTPLEKAIEKIALTPGTDFVLCYCTSGTQLWRMAWSHGHTQKSAVEDLLNYVRNGMAFDHEAEQETRNK
jgi:hypothetical protein